MFDRTSPRCSQVDGMSSNLSFAPPALRPVRVHTFVLCYDSRYPALSRVSGSWASPSPSPIGMPELDSAIRTVNKASDAQAIHERCLECIALIGNSRFWATSHCRIIPPPICISFRNLSETDFLRCTVEKSADSAIFGDRPGHHKPTARH